MARYTKEVNALVNSCKTCAEAKKAFKELSTKHGAQDARAIIAAACEIVKNRVAANMDDCKTAKNWLNDYNNILRAVFAEFVKTPEFIAANKGRFVGSCIDFVNKYTPIRTETGRVVTRKMEFVNGVKFVRYRFINATRAAVFSVLSACIESIRKNNIGAFNQIIIPSK